jgi:selenocysteine-specific elongation factor
LGIGREEFRSRLQIEPAIFNVLVEEMQAEQAMCEERRLLRLADHEINFSSAQQQAYQRLLGQLQRQGINSSSVKEVRTYLGDDVYSALIDLDQLVQLNAEVVYAKEIYEEIVGQVTSYLAANGRISVAELRDLLKTSRKYAIAILEHLDDTHVTKRQDDYRVMA